MDAGDKEMCGSETEIMIIKTNTLIIVCVYYA